MITRMDQVLSWALNIVIAIMMLSVLISFIAPWVKEAIQSLREIFKA